MIGYVTVGTNDLPKATKFYDTLFAELGVKRMMETERFVVWGASLDKPAFGVFKPFDGCEARPGNGNMTALQLETPAQVDALYRKALALGGSDEGAPGPRQIPGFYVGYWRDPEGNKLNFYCWTQG